MPDPRDPVVFALDSTRQMLHRFCDDLTPDGWLHRVVPAANPTAWIVGHLAVVDRNVLGTLGAARPALPDDDFVRRFGQGEQAPAAATFGDVRVLMPAFDEGRDALVAAAKGIDLARWYEPLDKPRAGGMVKTVGELLGFIATHTAIHVGQVTYLRRSQGLPPVI